jgi:hypothetical protein
MNDLTAKEQKAVRTALRFLRLRVGAWGPLAKVLRYEWDSIQKVATGRRAVTPALALRVARLAGVPMDELLAGRWLSPRVCPHCGHPPDDFVDEETVVDRGTPTGGLTILDGGSQ